MGAGDRLLETLNLQLRRLRGGPRSGRGWVDKLPGIHFDEFNLARGLTLNRGVDRGDRALTDLDEIRRDLAGGIGIVDIASGPKWDFVAFCRVIPRAEWPALLAESLQEEITNDSTVHRVSKF